MMLKACLAGFTAFALLACNTTDTISDNSKAKTLVNKDWQLVSWQYEPGLNISGENITDNYALLSPCVTDGKIRYSEDSTFIDDEGPTKCEEENNQTNTGTWSVNKNLTTLTKTYSGGSPETFAIETLNDTSLVISKLDSTLGDETKHKVIFGYAPR